MFNNGLLSRDFTYIDDIVEGTVRVIDHLPASEDVLDGVAYKIYNIGCGHPMQLMDFIRTLEEVLGKRAEIMMMPMQKGDVYTTYADTLKLEQGMHYKPKIELEEGVQRFVEWIHFSGIDL